MSSTETVSSTKSAAHGQPLFYQRPEALTPEQHGNLRLRKDGDFRFAKGTNAVTITSTEFVSAMRCYPIVFAAGVPLPLVVLGLEQENLFVNEVGGWHIGYYVPAYIRRYPFVFIAHPNGNQFVLGIDRAAGLLKEEGEGRALFMAGKPTDVTEQALSFCGAYQTDYGFTMAFGQTLEEQKLLIDNQAQAKLPNGKMFNLSGFRVVDRQKFAALPDAIIVEWQKKGWLALIHYHLASLERFSTLLELQGAVQPSNEEAN